MSQFPHALASWFGAVALLALCTALPVAAQTAAAPDASAPVTAGELPIHDAARMGTRAQVEALLRANPAHRDARTPLGATPLHHAAMNEDIGPLQALLAAGANPNARDMEGRTPLHMAAFATRTPHTQALLRAGADPLLKSEAGRDVLSMARKVRADEVAGVISLWLLKGCSKDKPC
jgi:ankyrin repeat protein